MDKAAARIKYTCSCALAKCSDMCWSGHGAPLCKAQRQFQLLGNLRHTSSIQLMSSSRAAEVAKACTRVLKP